LNYETAKIKEENVGRIWKEKGKVLKKGES